jgi:hypothetical protein
LQTDRFLDVELFATRDIGMNRIARSIEYVEPKRCAGRRASVVRDPIE